MIEYIVVYIILHKVCKYCIPALGYFSCLSLVYRASHKYMFLIFRIFKGFNQNKTHLWSSLLLPNYLTYLTYLICLIGFYFSLGKSGGGIQLASGIKKNLCQCNDVQKLEYSSSLDSSRLEINSMDRQDLGQRWSIP